ncbi:hypothetical protein V2J09_020719, partial [Rumex salicifolius]
KSVPLNKKGKSSNSKFGILLAKNVFGPSLTATIEVLMESFFKNVKQWLSKIDRYVGISFLETSAKNSINVEQAFMAITPEVKNMQNGSPTVDEC